jgi:hypothetical protein
MRRFAAVFGIAALLACGTKPPAAPSGPVASCAPAAGVVCFGTSQFVEYDAGELPIVISVPHGGALVPAAIPDRTGTTVTDLNTIELGRAIAQAFAAQTGRSPHVVFSLLRRTKLDPNREVVDAAQGNAQATTAWTEYHDFIGLAIGEVVRRSGRGLYIDLHGHGHDIQRLELGYLLSSATLDRSDADLDASGVAARSSLRLAMPLAHVPFSELLRGPTSLGGLIARAAVPGPSAASPGADPYFEGGYSTERHTAVLPGLQIECNFSGVRDTAANRTAFAADLVDAVTAFLRTHLNLVV